MPGRTPEGDGLTALVLPVYELAAAINLAAEQITETSAITPAMWQVLGLIIDEPLSVADIARRLGHARQSVQRLANVAVENRWAAWQDNPRHQRSRLLALTAHGREELAALRPRQHAWANAVGELLGSGRLAELDAGISALLAAVRSVATHRATGKVGSDP